MKVARQTRRTASATKREWVKHVGMVKAERRAYKERASKAKSHPDQCISIIIDGADQSKAAIPGFSEVVKELEKGLRMKMHVYGVIIHGHAPLIYTLPDHVPNGSNVTIECLQRTLHHLEATSYANEQLPDRLYLQLDNTSRQNKNRYLFGYLACLVAMGVFTEVFVSFLPVVLP